jgi:hypothetical protein
MSKQLPACPSLAEELRTKIREGFGCHDLVEWGTGERGESVATMNAAIVAALRKIAEEIPPSHIALQIQFARLEQMYKLAYEAQDWQECRKIMAEQRAILKCLPDTQTEPQA